MALREPSQAVQGLRIRKMRKEDCSAVAAIEAQIFPDPWSEQSFRDCLNMERGGGLVAEIPESPTSVDGQIIGYAMHYSAGGETHLTNIAVDNQWRRRKVGETILAEIIKLAHEEHSEAVFLEVRESNTAAQAMYRAFGFDEIYRRKKYYTHPPEDALIFARELR